MLYGKYYSTGLKEKKKETKLIINIVLLHTGKYTPQFSLACWQENITFAFNDIFAKDNGNDNEKKVLCKKVKVGFAINFLFQVLSQGMLWSGLCQIVIRFYVIIRKI